MLIQATPIGISKYSGILKSDAQRKPGSAISAAARAEVDYLLSRVAKIDPRAEI